MAPSKIANEVRSAAMAEARRRGLRAKVIADVLYSKTQPTRRPWSSSSLTSTSRSWNTGCPSCSCWRSGMSGSNCTFSSLSSSMSWVRRQLSDQVLAVVFLV